MASLEQEKSYHTFESRLLSFKATHPKPTKGRRNSVASKKNNQKTGGWPHSFLNPESLADAGFYFAPKANADDNVTCFVCKQSLAGWEEGDDVHAEHLRLAPGCGWAIVASIRAGNEEMKNEDPMSERMKEARRSTFGDMWPHDGKKGWQPKSKQLVDAGWICTPTAEADDNASCVYCGLSLDAWEPKDKPLVEHQKRADDCAFFRLVAEYKSDKKTAAKAKKPRASKASRLSTQSNITLISEAPLPTEEPAEEEDSIMTNATTATARAGGRAAKAKAPAAKGRKTRAKKQEPEEVAAPEPEVEQPKIQVEVKRAARGKKRTSDEMDEDTSIVTEQPPAAKRRVTRTRGSMALEESTISLADHVTAEPVAAPRKRGRPSRKVSTVSVTIEPTPIPDDDAIDRALEADLERPLTDDEAQEAQVAVEVKVTRARRISRAKEPATASPILGTRRTRASTIPNNASSLFDIQPVDMDESLLGRELAALEIEEQSKLEESKMEESKPLPKAKAAKTKQPRKPSAKQLAAAKKAEEAALAAKAEEEAAQAAADNDEPDAMDLDAEEEQPSPEIVVKKARKAGTRQTRQVKPRGTRASTVSVATTVDSENDVSTQMQDNDSGNDTDASQATIVKAGKTRRGSALKKGRGGKKKAASRHIEDIIHKDATPPSEQTTPKPKKGKEVVPNTDNDEGPVIFEDAIDSSAEQAEQENLAKSKKEKGKGKVLQELPIDAVPRAATPSSLSVPFSPKPRSSSRKSPQPPSTPGDGSREVVNASPSPQSSDAENHPPSSRPSTVRQSLNLQDPATSTQNQNQSTTTRIPLVSTPTGSPSKRNIINGLKTSQPWTALDLDTLFAKSPSKTNAIDNENDENDENRDPVNLAFNEILERARNGDVTSPEKQMSVEEWIKHNARMAELKLRGECERMVGVFEEAGQRAMRSVEGIKCYDDDE